MPYKVRPPRRPPRRGQVAKRQWLDPKARLRRVEYLIWRFEKRMAVPPVRRHWEEEDLAIENTPEVQARIDLGLSDYAERRRARLERLRWIADRAVKRAARETAQFRRFAQSKTKGNNILGSPSLF